MREILFRGKREYDNEWVYGHLVIESNEQQPIIVSILTFDDYEDDEVDEQNIRDFYYYYVIPETVGQYTGLTDKNGRKIFEGDIVKYSTNKVGIINYGTACFSVQDTKSRNNPALDIIFADYSNVEVIGDIHDNPELLKGGSDNG